MLGIQAVVIVLQIIKYVMFGEFLTPSIAPFYQESYGFNDPKSTIFHNTLTISFLNLL